MLPEPLMRFPYSPSNESLDQICVYPNLLLDPPYQRGSVWGPERQRNLWRSLLTGLPVGVIMLSVRDDEEITLAVVDGKQRIEAVLAFFNGSLSLPSVWMLPEAVIGERSLDRMVTWNDLTDTGKRIAQRPMVATFRVNGYSEEDERKLFDMINFGGLAQGESDFD